MALNCSHLATLISLCSVSFAVAAVPFNGLTDSEKRCGWRLLFDGRTTEGWRNYRRDAVSDGWVVEQGALTRHKKGAGDVISNEQFEHFELSIEYRISKGGNSGIMFHVSENEKQPWHTGPEVQILDNVHGHESQKAGWLYGLYRPKKPEWAKRFEAQVGYQGIDIDDATRPAGQWNHIYLRVIPGQGEVCVNGVSYFYFQKGSQDWNQRVAASKFAKRPNFGRTSKGHICLQDHGDRVAFRNIKIRELSAAGESPQPIDGTLPLKAVVAFPNIKWEGWVPVDDEGRLSPALRSVQVTHAGDGTDRVFVIDQSGMVHVLPNDPMAKTAKLFLDLRPAVQQWKIEDEEGLLGFAFHPRYAQNGVFFVYYNRADKLRSIRLSRFRVSQNDPNRADPDSEEILMTIEQPFANHNGGPMVFGPDGYLYVGMGDGGGRNDPKRLGQKRETLMGSVFRIDVDRTANGNNYAVPADNPFTGQAGVRPEIYAWGFRNPWRMAFDRRSGHLWLSDVGQDLWEEIDIVQKGGNFGWSMREGSYPFGDQESDTQTVAPVWEYDHRIGKSITGGFVYRGRKLPELNGHYLYGDYVAGKLWALHYDEENERVVRNMAIPWNGLPVLAFGEDEHGEGFVTTPAANGRGIYRLVRVEP